MSEAQQETKGGPAEQVEGEVVRERALTRSKGSDVPSYIVSATEAWGADRMRLLRDTLARDLTLPELGMFCEIALRLGLDPFARQIYAVKRWDSRLQREVMQTQTSIDGFRTVAQRTGEYRGQRGPYWCGDDGVWRDAWLDKKPPRAAKVEALRAGFEAPLVAVALWDEYVQTKKNGEPSPMWARMPSVMLAKCAEAIALRRAFPQELSGVYTSDEMGQADNEQQVEEKRAPRAKPKDTEESKPQEKPTAPTKSEHTITERLIAFKVKVDAMQSAEAIEAALASDKWKESLASLGSSASLVAHSYARARVGELRQEPVPEEDAERATQLNELAKE